MINHAWAVCECNRMLCRLVILRAERVRVSTFVALNFKKVVYLDSLVHNALPLNDRNQRSSCDSDLVVRTCTAFPYLGCM